MAEPRHLSSNGSSSGHKRRDTPAVCDAASTPMKKIKLEEEAPPMADPNTIEAVRGRNKALALDLLEKNRRIAFLTQKCEALYRRRVVTDSAFRCMRRQWLQLVNDAQSFTTALGEAADAPSGSEWQQLMAQFETLGEWRMPLDAVTLELPEWFAAVKKHNDGDDGDDAKDESKKTKTTESESAGADDEDHELAALTEPHEKELESELQTHRRMSTDILKRLVTALSSASTSSATRSSTSAAQILAEKQAAVSEMAELKDTLSAWHNEEAQLRGEYDEKVARLTDENTHLSEELSKLRHKATSMEEHVHDKWKKKLDKLQEELLGARAQIDEYTTKNVALRDKLAGYTVFRDQLNDSAVKREELEATRDAFKEENDALISEIEALGKEVSSVRHSKKKVLQQLEEKRASLKKTQGQLAKESDAKSHFFDELSAARLQVASLGQVHTQQKATLEAAKQALAAREAEVESLTRYLKQLEADRDVVAGEKLKVERDAEITKHLYSKLEASQKQQLLHDRKRGPCEHCERLQKKEAEFDKAIAASRSAASSTAASSNGLTNVERLELQDLQKQLKCSVCQDRHKGVIIAKCFHMFCKECVESNLKSRNRKCPTCKKMFGQDDVKNPNMAPRGARPNVLKRKRDLASHGPKGAVANKKLYALADPTLVLGDGDFSFSRGLATHRGGGRNLVATSFDSERTVRSKYSNATECIQAVVQAGGHVLHDAVVQAGGHVLHDVDATRLHAMPRRLPNGARTPSHFQYIVFNFPHTGQQRVHLNRVLLRDFFESARSRLLQRGEAHVTLKNRPPYSNWQVEDQAKAAGFVLKERRRFEAKHFPGYEHRTTDPQAKAFEAELCTTYVFIVNRSKFPFVPASALDVEEEEEKTDAHDADAIASLQRDATSESSEVTTSRKKNRKHKRRKTSPAGGSERCAEPDDAAIEEEAATLVTALWRPLHRRTWS
ncbi:hypothetical protein P43SY_004271 [Pythium insidiosum]|uniref:E3 ubiquitin protein ligase n=1 Tax=Pythium insidiosum TaxID=114742 RepID=A0AAD5Q7P3_PYTIN|nr:hypothetical protein P43SY_004271 [Pythium insidiosum]